MPCVGTTTTAPSSADHADEKVQPEEQQQQQQQHEEYHRLYFCSDSLWVWDRWHCNSCVEIKMPKTKLPRSEDASTHASNHDDAAGTTTPRLLYSRRRPSDTGPSPIRRKSELTEGDAAIASSAVATNHHHNTNLNNNNDDEENTDLWFCGADLFVYNREHCFQCEKFSVHTEKKNLTFKEPFAVHGSRGQDTRIMASIFAKGIRLPFESIPIVDVSALVEGLPSDHPRVVQTVSEIAHACRDVGFMYVVGHGVNPELRQRVFQQSRKFFSQSQEQKSLIDISRSHCHRGYFPVRGELLSTRGDLKEGLDLGLELSENDPDVQAGLPLHGPNQWPLEISEDAAGQEDAEFKSTCLLYMDNAMKLAACILRGFALALGLPENFFSERCKKPMASLRLLHYPPQDATEITADNVGCGAHTDYGCITLLAQDDTGGLQVWSGEKWVAAPPVKDAYVINTGDMTGMWTNELFPPTVHRVINISGNERYSIPFFYNPDYDTTIECLPQCVKPGEAPLYKPIKCGDHLNSRFDQSFVYRMQKK